MLGISSLYFIVTGIQFWMTDYLRNVLQQEKSIVFLTYSILSITAPTLGALFGKKSTLKTSIKVNYRRILCEQARRIQLPKRSKDLCSFRSVRSPLCLSLPFHSVLYRSGSLTLVFIVLRRGIDAGTYR